MCGCGWVCAGVRWCAQVCTGMHGKCKGVRGCAGVHGYAWIMNFQTRFLTSADFNMYPKQFFLLLIWAFEKIVAIFATLHLETLSEQLPKKLRESIICTLMSKVYI